ncbi:MTA1 [Cordylochernes scorpioides]|uniref:MTA1 n=1 Tax=Cordylochernes scorpioides TaxID=51811 RepID=A0ABY6L3R2_9ARAC|nr:MTA1 [Cordylochernes scorpioides]
MKLYEVWSLTNQVTSCPIFISAACLNIIDFVINHRNPGDVVQTQNGNVEAKVTCFYRRKDLSGSLVGLADKHQSALEEEREGSEPLDERELHQLRHRELFLSRQMETLPATHIRGKCCVALLNETEALTAYLKRDVSTFCTLSWIQPHFFASLYNIIPYMHWPKLQINALKNH